MENISYEEALQYYKSRKDVEKLSNRRARDTGPRKSKNSITTTPVVHTPLSRTRAVWNAMKQRCTNPEAQSYHNYGGRGIKVCDRWLESFDNFLEDMGVRPEEHLTLDRIDNNGNYEPGNCRWTTMKVQVGNRRVSKSQ